MKRSVRNGIAIAGMAGGIWFLGSAVASADDGQAAGAANNVDQSSSSESTGDGGSLNGAGNLNASSADATNVQATEVDTDVNGGDGGHNVAVVNTGVAPAYVSVGANSLTTQIVEEPEPAPVHEVNVDTGDVHVTQNANGGDVSGSGNVHVSGNSGDQTATAENNVHQTATSTSTEEDGDKGKGKGKGKGGDDEGSLNLAGNLNESESDATNIDVTDIETDVDGGDGGTNEAEINTGIIGNTFYCPAYSTCYFNFTTGDVTVVQNANGGDVNGSGNVNVGGDGYGHPHSDHHGDKPGHHHDGDCPDDKPTVKPSVKPASAPTYHRAPVSPTAQPAGQLAYTGADVSLPLTVGLIALGAGFALTAAGRRRVTETV